LTHHWGPILAHWSIVNYTVCRGDSYWEDFDNVIQEVGFLLKVVIGRILTMFFK
jgi:hypothetical protein